MATHTATRNGRTTVRPRPYQEKPFTLTLDLTLPRLTLSLRPQRAFGPQEASSNGSGEYRPAKTKRLLTLEGRRARLLQQVVLEALHKAGISLPQLEEKSGGRVHLSEASGARLALLLWALAPIQKPSRAALVQAGIAAMSDEEVYYWYARAEGGQAPSASQQRNNTLKALRILLAGE